MRIKRKSFLIILFVIVIFGLVIRNLYFSNILFGFEQGRDFSVAGDIASFKKLTLIGPKTDIEGIFHGTYYYYFLTVFYAVASGNPFIVAFLFTIINSLTILIMYKTCLLLFKSHLWGLIGAMLAASSFNLIIYARWISNVSPAVPIFAAFFYFIIRAIKSRTSLYLPAAVFFGFLLLHFEILSIFPVLTIIFFALVFYQIRFKIRDLTFCSFAILINIFPFILFEIKHKFLLINGVRGYLSSENAQGFNFINNLKNYLMGINKEISSTLFPFAVGKPFLGLFFLTFIFLTIIAIKSARGERKNAIFILFSIFGTFPLLVFLKYSSLEQFYVGASIPIIIFFVFFLWIINTHTQLILKSILFCFVAIFIFINIVYTETSLHSRNNIFYYTTQKEIAIGKKIAIIKFMQSFNEKYAFDAFTSPIHRPDGWHYLNTWLNKKTPFSKTAKPTLFFLVIEPFTDKHWLELWVKRYNETTMLIDEKNIDGIVVQMRKEI